MFLLGKRTIRACNEEWSKNRPHRSAKFPAARRKSNDRERIRAANYRALPARLPGTCASEDRSATANTLPFRRPHLAIPTGAREEASRYRVRVYAGRGRNSVKGNNAAR